MNSSNILAHRGWWKKFSEKNTPEAFHMALGSGFGIETDIRDYEGLLVISHDMPKFGPEFSKPMLLKSFLEIYTSYNERPFLALNIKADGLASMLQEELSYFSISQYFVFDMSIPDTLNYMRLGMPVFMRRSEYETGSILDRRATGFWLDSFEAPHVSERYIRSCLSLNQSVAIVSPELHGKPHHLAWKLWRDVLLDYPYEKRRKVLICTDYPNDAEEYFRDDLHSSLED